MIGSRPERVLDPVCGMTVDVAEAEEAGLTLAERATKTEAPVGAGICEVAEGQEVAAP